MKAIGYVRVSTDGQAREGVSLEAQREKIGAWANLNGCELGNVQVDAGLSGGRADNRPGLQAALDEVCRCKGVLVVYSLSRLARSTKDSIAISERLDKAGADLVSLSERIDTTGAAGRMIYRLLAVLAEFERDQISERTRTAMQHLKSQGRRVSGRIPYGCDLASDGATLTPNAAEQQTIQQIQQRRQSGETLHAIADALNLQGVPSKCGGKWSHKVVRDVLRRKAA